MQNNVSKIVVSLLFGIFLAALSTFGQITGDLKINVTDASDAVVPNATVTVRSLEIGTTRTANTDSAGSLRINQLAIGRYEVKISHDGFTTVTASA